VEASVADVPEWAGLFDRFQALGYTAYDLHNDYEWLSMLRREEKSPTILTMLPATQTDILFIRAQ
jgi:hypothetical protein